MKIAFCGDLHLEFGGRDFDLPDADVLLLAGDICVIEHLSDEYTFDRQGQQTAQFFMDVSAKYKRVIWIPGNHELYGGVMGDPSTKIVTEFFARYFITNIEYTSCDKIIIDDVTIVAATLWTDFNRGDPSVMYHIQYSMNDYHQIMIDRDGIGGYITPMDIYYTHENHRNFIKSSLNYDKVIVMSHHAPNLLSAGGNRPSNLDYGYCCTDVDDMILDNPQIKYWVCGHTHTRREYKIGETTVLSNCRGYKNYEKDAETFEIKVIEV